ncbi:21851_t:CDS:2 [Dentiscutata erythropus]|uniref:21851_t:CDS:1 n=1 Tax=Dentiscutata erythropus TaxID=1348616 RepID=A0A9N9N8D9_9GLOM|nr:21851_t:CDS:2 [Dentiscutata erythropus]
MQGFKLFRQNISGSLKLSVSSIFVPIAICSSFWRVNAAALPDPRWGHGAVLIKKNLYIFGGKAGLRSLNDTSQNTGQLLILDISSEFQRSNPAWVTGPVGPKVAYHTVSLGGSQNELLVVYGGESGETPPPLNSLFYFDTIAQNWSIPNITAPSRRREHTAVSRLEDASNFFFGGIPDSSSIVVSSQVQYNDLYQLQTRINNWIAVGPQTYTPSPRYHHTSTLLADGKMYVIGGFAGSAMVDTASIYIYDTINGQWDLKTAGGNSPSQRRDHAAVGTNDGKVIIHGGVDVTFTSLFSDIAVLDTKQDPISWITVSVNGVIPPGRYSHTATMIGTNMIIAFGFMANETADSNIYILDTTSFTWTDTYIPNKLEYTDTTPSNTLPNGSLPTGSLVNGDNSNKTAIIVSSVLGGFLIFITIGCIIIWLFLRKPRDDFYASPYFPQNLNSQLQPPVSDIPQSKRSTYTDNNFVPSISDSNATHEKTYSEVFDDRTREIDIQTTNMMIVPKTMLRVMNPDKASDES